VDSFDEREVERAQQDSWLRVSGARIVGRSPEQFAGLIVDALSKRIDRPRARLGVNGSKMPVSIGLVLGREVELVDVSLAMEMARVAKDALEIEWMAKACEIAEAGFQSMLSAVEVGMTELELAALAEYEMSRLGADYFWAGRTMVMTGPDAVCTLGTDSSTHRKVERGHLVHVDIFPSCHGYMADMARTIVMGSPTQEQLELIDANYRAFENAIGALKEGRRVKEIGQAAFQDMDAKYRDVMLGPGHGIGLNDDLYPRLAAASLGDVVLENGMAISIEIATMVPGLGGVRFEDNFIVNGHSPIRLSKAERLVVKEV
jgi:Xaa-Pro aminopeptidase